MEKLKWHGKSGYNDAKYKEWKVKGKKAGVFKSFENLSFVQVYGAGHMVPMDQPVNALAMVDDWLAGSVGKDE